MSEEFEADLRRLLKIPLQEEEPFGECTSLAFDTSLAGEDMSSPTFFGRLTSLLITHRGISRKTKLRACQMLFDAIPLPEREDEVFLTADRVPPHLQEAAHFLWDQDEFIEYHLLHMIYALYIDPERGAGAPGRVLVDNLATILNGDFEEGLKLLYVYLLLSSTGLPSRDARKLFSVVLRSPGISESSRRTLSLAALDRTFGAEWFTRLASDEGLYPPEQGGLAEVLREARVRPLPEVLSPYAEDWLSMPYEPEKPSKGGRR